MLVNSVDYIAGHYPDAILIRSPKNLRFGMGLTLKPADFKPVFAHPKEIIIGELAQFVIMPGAAWIICRMLDLPLELARGEGNFYDGFRPVSFYIEAID